MTASANAVAFDPHVFLIGRPPIGELLGFIRTMSIDGQSADLGALTAEWRVANDHVLQLEKTEAGTADNPPITPLPAALASNAQAVLSDPGYKRDYRFVPSDIVTVDLNRVTVFQKFINLAFVDELKHRLGQNPSDEAVFSFALPIQEQATPFRLMQNPNGYTFVSASTDFRFLEAQLVDPGRIANFEGSGKPVALVSLSIGYGSNFLSMLLVENRLVLLNGSHRAYALRDLGITQVPCLVQHVTRRDELDLVAAGEIASNPDRYLKSPRPPLLKDYFDPVLRKLVNVHRKNRVIRVQFGVDTSDAPA